MDFELRLKTYSVDWVVVERIKGADPILFGTVYASFSVSTADPGAAPLSFLTF